MTDSHKSDQVEQNDDHATTAQSESGKELLSILQQDISSMQETLTNVINSLSNLQKDFEAKIKYDNSKERTIDSLHKELQSYRNNLYFQHLRPLVMGIVTIYDDMVKITTKDCVEDKSQEIANISEEISDFIQDIEDVLNRHGFDIYQTDSEIFDPKMQSAQKIVNTDNPDFDQHIAKRVQKGLRYGERVIRAEIVTVYRYVTLTTDDN